MNGYTNWPLADMTMNARAIIYDAMLWPEFSDIDDDGELIQLTPITCDHGLTTQCMYCDEIAKLHASIGWLANV